MRKVVINRCFGGFGLSVAAYEYLGLPWDGFGHGTMFEHARDDPKLVEVVEVLGSDEASGAHSELRIVTIPDDVDWQIEEYDGLEHVAEVHRTWE